MVCLSELDGHLIGSKHLFGPILNFKKLVIQEKWADIKFSKKIFYVSPYSGGPDYCFTPIIILNAKEWSELNLETMDGVKSCLYLA